MFFVFLLALFPVCFGVGCPSRHTMATSSALLLKQYLMEHNAFYAN
jgi:hypothetical protein